MAGAATALIDVAPIAPRSPQTPGVPTRTSPPPVLLLHGSGPGVTAAANWGPVIPALSEDRRVLGPDQLGYPAAPKVRNTSGVSFPENVVAIR